MSVSTLLLVLTVGAVTGFLGGLFGKGGSALATPVLAAFGIPPIVAVASPLPATIPGALLAARQYRKQGHVDGRVFAWVAAIGLPATIVGAVLTRWITADHLVVATDVLVAGLGVSILLSARRTPRASDGGEEPPSDPERPASTTGEGAVALLAPPATRVRPATARIVVVAAIVGVVAGLLANSGGFLLAPLFLVVLHLPVRRALGTSLAASAALAVPGTLAHAALGHIDWSIVAAFAVASVPLSAVGARTALRVHPQRLEVVFGGMLVVVASMLLVWG